MPDLDNHMDDLFRKAADNYRPAAGESDWEKITPLINKGESKLFSKNKNSKKIKRSTVLLLLFLLTATGVITSNLLTTKNNKPISKGSSIQDVKKIFTTIDNIQSEKQEKNNNIIAASSSFITKNKIAFQISGAVVADEKIIKKNNTVISTAFRQSVKISEGIADEQEVTNMGATETNIPASDKQQTPAPPAVNLNDAGITKVVTAVADDNNTAALSKTISGSDSNTIEKNTTLQKVKKQTKQNGFYLGFTAGPEYSGVRKLELHPGYEAGIIAGYQLNPKLALETGILFSKKNYACDGKYFHTDKLPQPMPAGMEVLSLSGNCTVFEIPVKLNYTIVNNSNANFYLSAGFSSYLLSNENNRYKTLMSGIIYDMTGSYKNTSFYPAATADISIGFEKKLNKGNKLRLEPYLQLPLKGIGVGAMKITSAGVHASFILF
jgi:Outer membrane protein beta-barrel domain